MYELPKVFVTPGAGVKVPLPVGGELIPGIGKLVARSVHVERLIRTGDLVVSEPPAPAAEVKPQADAAKKGDGK